MVRTILLSKVPNLDNRSWRLKAPAASGGPQPLLRLPAAPSEIATAARAMLD